MVGSMIYWSYNRKGDDIVNPAEFISKILLLFGVTMYQLYLIFGCVLFCIIGYTISTLFNELHQKIKALSLRSSNSFVLHLEGCKEQYVLTCSLIDNMNDCFSNFLFLVISFYFVTMINNSFSFIVPDVLSAPAAVNLVYCMYPLLQLLLICYIPHQIQAQVY